MNLPIQWTSVGYQSAVCTLEYRLRVRMCCVHVGSLARWCFAYFNAKCASDPVAKTHFSFFFSFPFGARHASLHTAPAHGMDGRGENRNCCLDIRRHSRDAKLRCLTFIYPFLLDQCLLCRYRSQSRFKCDYNKTPKHRKKGSQTHTHTGRCWSNAQMGKKHFCVLRITVSTLFS